MTNNTGRKSYTRHCEYCDEDYTTTSKPYRGKSPVFASCSKATCTASCTEAYNTERERVNTERTAIKASQPKSERHYVATDWNYLVAVTRSNKNVK